jgi:hypothetical protein
MNGDPRPKLSDIYGELCGLLSAASACLITLERHTEDKDEKVFVELAMVAIIKARKLLNGGIGTTVKPYLSRQFREDFPDDKQV